jgi:hypothetical protein
VRIPFGLSLGLMASTVCAATLLVSRIDRSRGINLARGSVVTTSGRAPVTSNLHYLTDGNPWNAGYAGVATQYGDRPWILLDLGAERTVSRVVLYSCVDCEHPGNVPLALELSRDGQRFVEVRRQDQSFELWEPVIPPRPARFLRFRLLRPGYLRFREIEVY